MGYSAVSGYKRIAACSGEGDGLYLEIATGVIGTKNKAPNFYT